MNRRLGEALASKRKPSENQPQTCMASYVADMQLGTAYCQEFLKPQTMASTRESQVYQAYFPKMGLMKHGWTTDIEARRPALDRCAGGHCDVRYITPIIRFGPFIEKQATLRFSRSRHEFTCYNHTSEVLHRDIFDVPTSSCRKFLELMVAFGLANPYVLPSLDNKLHSKMKPDNIANKQQLRDDWKTWFEARLGQTMEEIDEALENKLHLLCWFEDHWELEQKQGLVPRDKTINKQFDALISNVSYSQQKLRLLTKTSSDEAAKRGESLPPDQAIYLARSRKAYETFKLAHVSCVQAINFENPLTYYT